MHRAGLCNMMELPLTQSQPRAGVSSSKPRLSQSQPRLVSVTETQKVNICPAIHQAGIKVPDKVRCKVNRNHFSQRYATAVKGCKDPLL